MALPGPSRTITVEPVKVPVEKPKQLPAPKEPAKPEKVPA